MLGFLKQHCFLFLAVETTLKVSQATNKEKAATTLWDHDRFAEQAIDHML